MAILGLKDLVYAVITEENKEETIYGEAKPLGPARAFNLVPSINRAGLNADDAPLFSDVSKGPSAITLDTAYIDNTVEADVLGKKLDKNGGVVDSAEDEAPYIAVGGRSLNARGGYDYFWVYRIKFAPSDENRATKEETPEYQTPTLTGEAIPRLHDGLERYKVWENNPDITDKTVFDTWFKKVTEPLETP